MNLPSLLLRTVTYNYSSLRFISTLNIKYNKYAPPPSTFLKDFTPVYKFPLIRAVSIVNRLKLYQTIFTGMAIPGSFVLNEFNLMDIEGILVTSALGLSGCIALYSLGSLSDKFIGFVYLNKQENSVKIAYVDYWGRRQNKDVPLKDIVPFSEIPVSFMDRFYLKLTRFSDKERLKINLKHGQILNKEKFDKVFESFR